MPKKTVSVITDATDRIKLTWQANPTFKLGDVTLEALAALQKEVLDLGTVIDAKRHEIQGLVDQRDDQVDKLQVLNSRALSAIRGIFGGDSPQYDQAGGIRTSKRQTRRPTAKPSILPV